jgi:hypothetical protein
MLYANFSEEVCAFRSFRERKEVSSTLSSHRMGYPLLCCAVILYRSGKEINYMYFLLDEIYTTAFPN